jgi:hypothetical protein
MRFQVVTVLSMKMAIYWDVTPRSLTEIDRSFSGAYCLNHRDNHPDE